MAARAIETEMKDFAQPPVIHWQARTEEVNVLVQIVSNKVLDFIGYETVKNNLLTRKEELPTHCVEKLDVEIPFPRAVLSNALFDDDEKYKWSIPIGKLLLLNKKDLQKDWENHPLDSLERYLRTMLKTSLSKEDVAVFSKLMKEDKLNKVLKGVVAHSVVHLLHSSNKHNQLTTLQWRLREKETDLMVVRLFSNEMGQGLYDLFEARVNYCSSQSTADDLKEAKIFDIRDANNPDYYPTHATRMDYIKKALDALKV